jgi:hypothetical protein
MINDHYPVAIDQISVSIVNAGRFFVKGFTGPIIVSVKHGQHVTCGRPLILDTIGQGIGADFIAYDQVEPRLEVTMS